MLPCFCVFIAVAFTAIVHPRTQYQTTYKLKKQTEKKESENRVSNPKPSMNRQMSSIFCVT